jgi:diketogulonate reductase-like aldo/keto reductase
LLGSNPNIRPVVNQLEIHPWNTREELVNFCLEQNIQIEAYSPLTKGRKLNDADLLKIAAKYDKSPAQILIRWSLQHGYIVLPKSVTPERIASNVAVFDFDLSDSDMKTLDEKDEYLLTGKHCWIAAGEVTVLTWFQKLCRMGPYCCTLEQLCACIVFILG